MAEATGDLLTFVRHVASKVDSFILENMRGEPGELYEAALHIIKAGGKRMRPAILMATGLMMGGDEDALLPFASAVELIHTFTLVHDDIMDNDEYRRNVKTVHAIWGVPTAIVAGDLLFSKSFEIPLSMRGNIDTERALGAVYELSRATSIVAEGQMMDMQFERRSHVSVQDYLKMIYKKTAALIEASAAVGAIISGASYRDVENLRLYGRKIGLAFQMVDDILGIYGEERVTGKPVYSDFREGKKTLLVIKALEVAGDEDKELITRVLGKNGLPREEYEKAAKTIERLGVRREVEDEARRLVKEALHHLSVLEGVKREIYKKILEEAALYTVMREK